jgi:hypothetical protein
VRETASTFVLIVRTHRFRSVGASESHCPWFQKLLKDIARKLSKIRECSWYTAGTRNNHGIPQTNKTAYSKESTNVHSLFEENPIHRSQRCRTPPRDTHSLAVRNLQYPNSFQCKLKVDMTGDDLPQATRYLWSGIRNYVNLNPLTVSAYSF